MKKRDRHLRELVALSLIPNIGARRVKTLLEIVDHPRDLFRMKRNDLESVYGIGPESAAMILKFNQWEEVDRVIEQTAKGGHQIITLSDDTYPGLLREIFDPPTLLWVFGDVDVLNSDSIAIVGTRKCSAYGKDMAEYFVKELVAEGLTIVSGLAYGIDARAHEATVREGGRTIAVLGSGINKIYPSQHIRLARQITEQGGAVISEFPLGTAPEAGNFPVRNRVVSGMTLGTLVVESGREGGSMITATSALDQNREVFVVPHAITNPAGAGCNHLIRSGQGKLVDKVEDILREISVQARKSRVAPRPPAEKKWKQMELNDVALSICKLLDKSPLHIDTLGETLDIPVQKVLAALLELEMQGCIQQNPGKIFSLK